MSQLWEALHAEWTKLRTVPSTGWLLVTAIVLTIGASTLATVAEKCPASCGVDTTRLSLTGILLGPIVSTMAVTSSHPVLGTVRSFVHSARSASHSWLMRLSGAAGR